MRKSDVIWHCVPLGGCVRVHHPSCVHPRADRIEPTERFLLHGGATPRYSFLNPKHLGQFACKRGGSLLRNESKINVHTHGILQGVAGDQSCSGTRLVHRFSSPSSVCPDLERCEQVSSWSAIHRPREQEEEEEKKTVNCSIDAIFLVVVVVIVPLCFVVFLLFSFFSCFLFSLVFVFLGLLCTEKSMAVVVLG